MPPSIAVDARGRARTCTSACARGRKQQVIGNSSVAANGHISPPPPTNHHHVAATEPPPGSRPGRAAEARGPRVMQCRRLFVRYPKLSAGFLPPSVLSAVFSSRSPVYERAVATQIDTRKNIGYRGGRPARLHPDACRQRRRTREVHETARSGHRRTCSRAQPDGAHRQEPLELRHPMAGIWASPWRMPRSRMRSTFSTLFANSLLTRGEELGQGGGRSHGVRRSTSGVPTSTPCSSRHPPG